MKTTQPLKVALVCHSDRLGGAAIVTYRLMQALRAAGVDARMVVYTRMSDPRDGLVYHLQPRWKRAMKFLTERVGIAMNNGFKRDTLFMVSTASQGMPLWKHPWVREADIINLNWINQGVVSLKGLRRLGALGKPIVWTMHDMWCLTGICHHARQCTNYERECGCCPYLRSSKPNDLSHKVWERKKQLYGQVPFHFVAVSSWLAGKCAESSLLRDAKVDVIHNAFPVDTFPTEPYDHFPSFEPIQTRRRIVMGAARLDDPIKGLDKAIAALNILFDNHADEISDTGIIFFGDIRDRKILDNLRFSYIYVGRVSDPRLLRQYYASADVVVSASDFETLPGTIIEGQAAGAIPVTFGEGGQSDIITHLEDGYIAQDHTPEALAEGILWALRQPSQREKLHRNVAERFSADKIAGEYMKLYSRLLSNRK